VNDGDDDRQRELDRFDRCYRLYWQRMDARRWPAPDELPVSVLRCQILQSLDALEENAVAHRWVDLVARIDQLRAEVMDRTRERTP
jgi:hypothetical protein